MPVFLTTDTITVGIPVNLGGVAGLSVVVTQGVTVASETSGTRAIIGTGSGQGAFINGLVAAQDAAVVRLEGANATVSVSATGVVQALETHGFGSGTAAIYLPGGGTVMNHGLITGDSTMIIEGGGSVLNTGTIQSADFTSINFAASSGNAVIANSGTIVRLSPGNAINVNTGIMTLSNTGTILGGVSSSSYADVVTNSGLIQGTVALGGNDDLYDGRLGRITGDILAGDGSDTVLGGTFGEEMFGENGNDSLRGGDGDDSLSGDAGNDLLYGDHGFDHLMGGIGIDTLYGGTGDDSLLGGDDADVVYGGTGDDSLYGEAGNDVLIGGAGADSLDGGAGSRDRAQYTDATAGLRADLQVTAFNSGAALNDSYTGIEDLYGTFYGDTLLGDTNGNFIGGDFGADLIDGRLGSDTLAGGLGNDTLTGGAGADVFVFNAALASNTDTVSDYSVADDTIQLAAAVFAGLAPGALAGAAFTLGAGASTAAHRIIYNSANGQLLYDADGTGAGAAVHFATLSAGLAMVAGEFLVA